MISYIALGIAAFFGGCVIASAWDEAKLEAATRASNDRKFIESRIRLIELDMILVDCRLRDEILPKISALEARCSNSATSKRTPNQRRWNDTH